MAIAPTLPFSSYLAEKQKRRNKLENGNSKKKKMMHKDNHGEKKKEEHLSVKKVKKKKERKQFSHVFWERRTVMLRYTYTSILTRPFLSFFFPLSYF